MFLRTITLIAVILGSIEFGINLGANKPLDVVDLVLLLLNTTFLYFHLRDGVDR